MAVDPWRRRTLAALSLTGGEHAPCQAQRCFRRGLKETAERILALAVDSLRDDANEPLDHHEAHEIPLLDSGNGEYIVYQVRDAGGAVLLRSHDAPLAAFNIPLVQGFADSGAWRVYTVGSPDDGVFTQVAAVSYTH